MLVAEPLFGLGIGQYFLWSRHFASPELLLYYQRENAHNNFAQIAGELGIAGLISFIAVLVVALWRRGEERRDHNVAMPVLLGLAAFILTWLGGHPLLVAEVAYPFWLTLGVAAAVVARDSNANLSAAIVGLAVALLLVSVPFRVNAKSAQLDFTEVTYGLSAKRLMTSRARFFVPGAESRIDIPLRARSASEDVPVEIEVLVDGSASETIALHDRNWRNSTHRLAAQHSVPPFSSDRPAHQASRIGCRRSRSVAGRGWQVGDNLEAKWLNCPSRRRPFSLSATSCATTTCGAMSSVSRPKRLCRCFVGNAKRTDQAARRTPRSTSPRSGAA